MKYYFITYLAHRATENGTGVWNTVIDTSPMEFILQQEDDRYWWNYVITNVHEITKEEFDEYKNRF